MDNMPNCFISKLPEVFCKFSRDGYVVAADMINPRWGSSIFDGITVLIHDALSMVHYITFNYFYSFFTFFICDLSISCIAGMAAHQKLIQMVNEICISIVGSIGNLPCLPLHYHLFSVSTELFKGVIAPEYLVD